MIREYNESDYNAVNVLGRDINPDYFIKFNSVSKCFVYEEDDEVVGFILADIFDDRAEIIDVAVEVMHRNNKIGDKLVKHVIELCKEKGCNDITLEVRVNNDAAIKLYKNNDFKIVSIRKKYYSKGTVDANLMQRKL
ncbi:MAG: ribosomal protein S18-alanine N-acetyltransferase [Bacilli bacterium]|nr:ribosomal protein S18-alanine N-acetyltransferase [Bacilli bacterium]MBQ6282461.1 ribosomal protein S18-alanine N-acetyltransferase [Bacilli bacterium]